LLNGRVYGARRASEIAELQKKRREAAEPAFVEWGNAKPETTTAPTESSGGRGFLGDADEGSGMEWVKRRRAEREQAKAKREAEEKARAAQAASMSGQDGVAPDEVPPLSASSPYSSENERVDIVTPAQQPSELPTTPVIHISEHDGHQPRNLAASSRHDMGESETQAIEIKPGQGREQARDVFDDEDDEDSEEEEEEEDPDAEDDEEDVPMPR
jgi:hypothetical protein